METRLPRSEIAQVHRALQRKHDRFEALVEALLWRNQAVADQLDSADGPTGHPNSSQVALATVALLDMEVMSGGLLQFIFGTAPAG